MERGDKASSEKGENKTMNKREALRYRIAPLEMTPSEFRKAGRQLVERIMDTGLTLPIAPPTP